MLNPPRDGINRAVVGGLLLVGFVATWVVVMVLHSLHHVGNRFALNEPIT